MIYLKKILLKLGSLKRKDFDKVEKFKTVILAEKPNQARDYAQALGIKSTNNGYYVIKDQENFDNAVVTYAMGHLIEMATPDQYKTPVNAWQLDNLPCFPKKFEYQVTASKRKQFNIVKKLLTNCELIINATDYGREGSNIFYSILNEAGITDKTILRYANGSLVHEDIRQSFKQLENNDKDILMFHEAKTRQISDWLVGMNLTSLYTNIFRKKGINEVFPVGRVQTPTLFLIYQRQQAIENFQSKPFYEIEGQFQAQNGTYEGKAKFKSEDKEEANQLFEKHQLDKANQGNIIKLETSEKRKTPPKLFSLSLLQQKASELFKYTAKDTLNIAQSLYDKKILTYPRTDTPQITPSEFGYLLKHLDQLKDTYDVQFEVEYTTPRKAYVIDKVEEHHAIIPTSEIPSKDRLNQLSQKEKNILKLVVKTTLAMFAKDYIYDETNVETDVNGLVFYSKGRIVKEEGWKKLLKMTDNQSNTKTKNSKNKQNDENVKALPKLSEGENVNAIIKEKTSYTKPPQYFNDKDLIQAMKNVGKTLDDKSSVDILKETQGLGTEATRADVIDGLLKRGYIETIKHRYHVTKKGQALCTAVEGSLLASPEMTASWEQHLKEIGQGEKGPNQFLKVTKQFIQKELSLYNEKIDNAVIHNLVQDVKKDSIIGDCPNCGNGKITKQGKVYKCSNCEQIFFSNFFKKSLSENQIIELVNDGKTKKKLKLKTKDDKDYEAYLKLVKDDTKGIYIYKPTFN